MAQKLLVIIGVTGNQGHSVASRFLDDPTYKIRGLTRDPSSATAKSLSAKGIEIVQADLNDASTLVSAFAGASLIFSVTQFWEPFFRPDYRAQAKDRGIDIGKLAYEVEYQQGVNIADAAATTVDTLEENGFIASTLSAAKECSGGRWSECWHFDAKSDVFPKYVNERYPKLAAKMSCVQTGCFMTSFRLAPTAYFTKKPDGSYLTRFPMSPNKKIQHLDVNSDMGRFVYAVSKMPAGKSYMAAGTTCTWPEYCETWTRVTGVTCTYEQVTLEEMVGSFDERETGKEIGEMFAYSDDPGYDGGKRLLGAEDLKEAGVECPMTTLEEFMKRQDWKEVLEA